MVAAVAPTAVTGIARVQQNGAWSNAVGFIVPVAGGSNTLAPSMLNMVVGDTHTIQALNSAGQPVTGLTWTSSDPTIVSLSTDNPPILTALAAGHVTIKAGTASTDVTVWAGALSLGTVIWSNPGNGSGVNRIVPAVPSPTGVADVFAFQADGTVQAITSDGVTAWTADVSQAYWWPGAVVPDFQGGLVAMEHNGNQFSVVKLDGMTGQRYPAFTVVETIGSFPTFVVHPDGTIFATTSTGLVGIDPTTGAQKFSAPMDTADSPLNPADGIQQQGLMIGGDGYAYMAYAYGVSGDGFHIHLKLLRVNSSGAYDNIPIFDHKYSFGPDVLSVPVNTITNADQGILLSWPSWGPGMALTNGTSVTNLSIPQMSNQSWLADVVLQAQDGTFIGTMLDGYSNQSYMVNFDQSGTLRWAVPNEQPQIATDDGGVIGASGITYDQNGSATGQNNSLNSSQYPGWLGNVFGTAYSISSSTVSTVSAQTTNYATTFAALPRGNASAQGTSIQQVLTKLPQTNSKQLPDLSGKPTCYATPIPELYFLLTPTCSNINAIELLTSESPDFIFKNLIRTFAPATKSASPPNSVMTFTGPGNTDIVNVTGPGQVLTISLNGFTGKLQHPFSVMTETFDPVARTISTVTLAGHPLAGWRYWRVYSIGTNDVVIETGAYDQPAPGPLNYVGYYISQRTVLKGWQEYLQYIQHYLGAPQGSSLGNTLGGIKLRNYSWPDGRPLAGYWDYSGDFTQYILNNVCKSSTCN